MTMVPAMDLSRSGRHLKCHRCLTMRMSRSSRRAGKEEDRKEGRIKVEKILLSEQGRGKKSGDVALVCPQWQTLSAIWVPWVTTNPSSAPTSI